MDNENLDMDKRSMVMRRITKEDTELVYGFFNSISEQSRKSFYPHPFDRAYAEFITGTELDDPDICRYLAILHEGDEKIAVGYMFFWNCTKDILSLGIAVSDDYQGKGLGKKMMDFLISEALKSGKKGLHLTTDKDNSRGRALYLKCGFIIAGEGEHNDYIMKLDFNSNEDKFIWQKKSCI
jgi:RimJ/RimL family protein N-acetyltransferase